MTGWRKRTIMEMAQEAGIGWAELLGGTPEFLKAFAKLVREDEREECAKVCETLWDTPDNGMSTEEECYGNQCATAIRARGEQA